MIAFARRCGLAALLAAAVPGLAGCASLPFGAGYSEERARFGDILPEAAESLAPREATDRDVMAVLGPPAAITALPEGYAFLYEGGALVSRSVGGSIFSVRGAYAWSARELASAAFVFDDGGELVAAGVERSRDGTGIGFSIGTQGASAADQIVYLLPSSTHLWGRSMLRRLPVLLNSQSSLVSGEAGFERRGTTTRVGQNALPASHVTALALLELLRQQTGQ